MPVDPPHRVGGRPARLRGRVVSGEGADRDQALEASVAVVGTVRISTRPPGGMTVLAAGPGTVGEERGLTDEEVLARMGELLEAIADPGNLAAAWVKVRANAGAAGVDGQSIAAFGADSRHQLAALRRRLLSAERYVPPPVRRVDIPKPDGRTRPLGIPTVADRVVQQATVQVIGPIFEATFTPSSFGYRPNKGAQQAVQWVREAIRRGDRWVAEFDIVGFFDNLRHRRLLREVAKEVDDVEVLGLIRRWLTAGVLTESGLQAREAGTPQGGVISPLLANVYLHRLDVEVREAGFRLIRYADDFVILADRRWKAEAADRLVRDILADIGLEVAEAKKKIWCREPARRVRAPGLLVQGEVPSTTGPSVDQFQGSSPCPDSTQRTRVPGHDDRRPQPALAGLGQLLRHRRCPQSHRGPRQVDPDAPAVQSPQALQVQGRHRPPPVPEPHVR